jgi:autoinducer 2-degrading protein
LISLTVHLEIDPAREAEFLAAIGENAVASRAEPGCRRFEVHRCLDRPAAFVLWEVYDDSAALAAHHASAHFARWKQRSADGLLRSKQSLRCGVLE